MTAHNTRFQLSPQTRIRTPEVVGLSELTRALGTGQSILATPGDTPISAISESEQWLYCQSSGSTGYAKTIRRTPTSWIRSFDMDRRQFDLGEGDVVASLGTLSHSLTLFAAVFACHVGADLAMLGGTGPRRQMSQLTTLGATVLYATPAQFRLLVRANDGTPPPTIRLIFSSGGKLDDDLRDALGRLFPSADLHEIFGATETSYITLSHGVTPRGSVGRAYPGVEIRIADPDDRGVGEIWLRSPYLFDGYAKGSSKETRWQDGWLTIGEMGRLDRDGNLFPKGRRNRMVTVADQNVFPEEIESLLMGVEGVDCAVALALPDPKRGHRIVALVQGEADIGPMRQLCRQTIGDHAVPKEIRSVAQIPMLAAGKPDLLALTRLLQADEWP
ncbi:AMP-binding protein [Phaeobacter sp. B1627]|uniref:AMP-binding protein n=1 Tax=Phaeobacter sp. B1627 TaxID=2583809 RepID=UPI001118EF83|nr:AMP-binding protein [Phaeobacter sp. B1627]TNJ42291.1 long-chain fatty acid--CoA ligase [Phaeobacter sp. B1627]